MEGKITLFPFVFYFFKAFVVNAEVMGDLMDDCFADLLFDFHFVSAATGFFNRFLKNSDFIRCYQPVIAGPVRQRYAFI